MLFGLTNATTISRRMVDHTFWDLLATFLIIYLDDLLKRLREYGLYANQVEFLGYVISSEGISMDQAKVKTVVE